MISDLQKEIYNLYLKELAIKNNRPFARRKDFDNLSEAIKTDLLKLELFFIRNPEINRDLYFKAGFTFSNDTFLTLGYFHNLNVLKHYAKLEKQRYNVFIDSDESIKDFVEGLKFIISFLKENNLTLKDYSNCKNDYQIYWYLIHLKLHKISLYHLHTFNISIQGFEEDILNIYLENFRQKFFETRRQYTFSKKLKIIGNKITTIQTQNK